MTGFNCKKKCDQLRKEWKVLKKGAIGYGSNPKRRTVDVSNEWWKEKIQEFPVVKRFRYSGIDPSMEEKLDDIFMNEMMIGEHAWAPNSRSLPLGVAEDGHGDFEDCECAKSLSGDVKTLSELPHPSGGSKRAPRLSSHAKEKKNKIGCPKSGVRSSSRGAADSSGINAVKLDLRIG